MPQVLAEFYDDRPRRIAPMAGLGFAHHGPSSPVGVRIPAIIGTIRMIGADDDDGWRHDIPRGQRGRGGNHTIGHTCQERHPHGKCDNPSLQTLHARLSHECIGGPPPPADSDTADVACAGEERCNCCRANFTIQTGQALPGHRRGHRPSALAEGATHIGELQAWDLRTMQKAWTQTFTSPEGMDSLS
jgi:hypothetical protein